MLSQTLSTGDAFNPMPDNENNAYEDPFGAVKSFQIQQLNASIQELTKRIGALEHRIETRVVTRIEMYMTLLVVLLGITVVSLLIYIFTVLNAR